VRKYYTFLSIYNSSSEKYEIIQFVQQSSLSVTRTQTRLDIHKSTFYNWLGRYHDGGLDALDDKKPQPSMAWNRVPTEHRQALIDFALRETDLSPRELAVRYCLKRKI
jgi:putative transposase